MTSNHRRRSLKAPRHASSTSSSSSSSFSTIRSITTSPLLLLGSSAICIASSVEYTTGEALLDAWNRMPQSSAVVYALIGANVAVYAFLQTKLGHALFPRHFLLSLSGLRATKNYHTLLTMAFSHQHLWHLGANMVCLYSLGGAVAEAMGVERFAALYTIGALASSVASVAHWKLLHRLSSSSSTATAVRASIGASGAICAVVMAFAWTHPSAQLGILFLPFVSFSAWKLVAAVAAFDGAGAVLGWKVFNHVGHLAGMLAGCAWMAWEHTQTTRGAWRMVAAPHSTAHANKHQDEQQQQQHTHGARAIRVPAMPFWTYGAHMTYRGTLLNGRPHGEGTLTTTYSTSSSTSSSPHLVLGLRHAIMGDEADGGPSQVLVSVQGRWSHGWISGPATVRYRWPSPSMWRRWTWRDPHKPGERVQTPPAEPPVVAMSGRFEKSRMVRGMMFVHADSPSNYQFSSSVMMEDAMEKSFVSMREEEAARTAKRSAAGETALSTEQLLPGVRVFEAPLDFSAAEKIDGA